MANVILYSQIGYRPWIWRGIGCYTLARWLEEHGYTCQVIEFTHLFSPQDLIDYTKMFIDDSTLLLGISSTMWTDYDNILRMRGRNSGIPENINKLIDEIKLNYPKIKTLIGGPGQYSVPDDVFDFKNTDAYGEDGLLKLVDELAGQSFGTKLQRKKFSIEHQRFTYKEHDCILPEECLPIEWGRGCIFQCPFCRDPNLGKRPGTDEKNVSLMVDEFTEMYEKFGTTSYYFIDETFNASVERIDTLEKVYNLLPFKLEFLSYNRADLLDKHKHTQDILYNCGQRGTLMGIETFHPESAKLASKPWSAKRGKDFLLELKDKWPNTHIDCSFISGFPTESKKDLMETADWLKQSNLGFYWFIPLMMVNNERNGLFELQADNKGITWPDPDKPLHWEWQDMSWIEAYHSAAFLNRYMNNQGKVSMWNLGPLKTMGFEFSDFVNKNVEQIFEITGDWYDQETRLFNLYKEKLKTFAGR